MDWGGILLCLVMCAVVSALVAGAGKHYLSTLRERAEQSPVEPSADAETAPAISREPERAPAAAARSPEAAPALSKEPEPASKDPAAAPPPRKEGDALSQTAARVAIVMDDCGPNIRLAREVLALGLPLTWAILPGRTYSGSIAKMLGDAEVPFLVHVPMQALSDPDGRAGESGMYDIGVGMGDAAVAKALSVRIDSLPGAYGINNHRGSRATGDRETMLAVMDELARRGLFFLDSSTSSKSVAYATARAKGLRTQKNRHFLDNEADRVKIASEMKAAIRAAKIRGDTVVICHLRPETAAFLTELAKWDLASMGVRLVTLPQLAD